MLTSPFDFQDYLFRCSSINNPRDVSIQALQGGITNLTVRVTFRPPIPRRLVQERFSILPSLQCEIDSNSSYTSGDEVDEPPLATVVLKHAMPYLAGRPSQAMDVGRQTKEANALRFLAELHSGEKGGKPNSISSGHSLARPPELVFHDTVSNVLWIEDLGDNQLLVDFLLEESNREVTSALASKLAAFLANLYGCTKSTALFVTAQEEEKGERGDAALNAYFSESVRTILTAHAIEDIEGLMERVEESLYSRDKEGPCLGMVDFWPGNILVRERGGCGVIDWEYFGVSSAASELGMFSKQTFLIDRSLISFLMPVITQLHIFMFTS